MSDSPPRMWGQMLLAQFRCFSLRFTPTHVWTILERKKKNLRSVSATNPPSLSQLGSFFPPSEARIPAHCLYATPASRPLFPLSHTPDPRACLAQAPKRARQTPLFLVPATSVSALPCGGGDSSHHERHRLRSPHSLFLYLVLVIHAASHFALLGTPDSSKVRHIHVIYHARQQSPFMKDISAVTPPSQSTTSLHQSSL
jgi:hypothetical protein